MTFTHTWKHLVRYLLLLAALNVAGGVMHAAEPGARVVKYSKEDIVPVHAKLRFSTLIVLPDDEEILDFTTGDREFWIINGSHNLCYVHPAQGGNFVLDTSPAKHQVVWRIDGLDREQAEALLRSLSNQFGGDPAATDVSRVLRLPNFTNKKYNEAFVVRVHHDTDQVYHLGDFRLQEDSPDAPRHLGDAHEPSRRISSGHRSQSEADWAYAKRALARGDEPGEIMRRIADYRSDDKADPAYYAQLTVTKAQAAFASQKAEDPKPRSADVREVCREF